MVVSRSLRDSAIQLKVPVTIKGALVNNIGITPHSVGQKEQILGNFQKFYQAVGVNFKGSAIQNKHLSSKKKVKQVKKLKNSGFFHLNRKILLRKLVKTQHVLTAA